MSSTFEIAFPAFVTSCSDLYALLFPIAMAILVLSFGFEFWHGPPHPGEMLKFLVKMFFIVMLLAKSHDLINSSQEWVQSLLQNHIPASPEKVAARFQEKLEQAQDIPEKDNESFLSRVFSANWFEAILFAVLTLISWLAMALLYFIYSVQRAALLLCWAMGPLLLPLIAIKPVSSLGVRHIFRTIAIIMWPIGLALAATFTNGLIDVTTDRNFLANDGVIGGVGRGMISILAVMVISVWVIFSTLAAPIYIQRLIAGGVGPTSVLTKSADLITNIALPTRFGVPAAAHNVRQAGQFVLNGAGRAWQWVRNGNSGEPKGQSEFPGLVMPSLSPQSTQPSSHAWQPNPTDPTGDRQASTIVQRAKSK